jgi:hypothetical protein
MKKTLNIYNLIFLFYIIIPGLFYGIIVVFSYYLDFISFHFYKTYHIAFNQALIIWISYLLFGFFIFKSIKSTRYIVSQKKSNILINIFILFLYLLSLIIHINIINMFLSALLIIIFSNYRIYNITFIILLFFSITQMTFNEDRYAVIFILLIWLLPFLSRRGLLTLVFATFFSLFFLIFILQPLRYGVLPFSNGIDFAYIYKHLSPIYLTAIVSNNLDFTFQSLIVEVIPFGKSMFGEIGIIDRIAEEVLPLNILNQGTRLGSNTTMYFSLLGIPILIIMILNIKLSLYIIKTKIFYNSILFYLILQGPYFIRRSFASFTIDIIIIIFMVLMILMIKQTFKKAKIER